MASDGSQKLPPKAYDYMSYMPGGCAMDRSKASSPVSLLFYRNWLCGT